MDRAGILELIREQNPWWTKDRIPLPEQFALRTIGPTLEAHLQEERITTVSGLRRTGKTTLLHWLIHQLVHEEGIDPQRVCYFSFDLANETPPRRIFTLYEEDILATPFSDLDDPIYIFLDEAQKVEDWGNEVKSIHDRGYPVKFVVTGSSAMNLTKGAGESLAGRIRLHRLETFSFPEFLRYKGLNPPNVTIDNPVYPENAKKLRILFADYLESGGLPEFFEEQDRELLKQTLDLVFFRDIVEMFPVKRADVLKGLFRIFTEHTGQRVNYTKHARDLDTDYQTVKSYIQYLEDSYLIHASKPFTGSTRKEMRKRPKVYVADHAYTHIWDCGPGLRAETVAFNHLRGIEEPFYNQNPEIDLVLPESKLGIEVKHRENVSPSHAQALTELPEDFSLILASKNTFETWNVNGREVTVLPLWMLCLANTM